MAVSWEDMAEAAADDVDGSTGVMCAL